MREDTKELKINKGYRLDDGTVLTTEQLVSIDTFYRTACIQEYVYENYLGYSVDECAAIASSVLGHMDKGMSESDSIEEEVKQRRRVYQIWQIPSDTEDREIRRGMFQSYEENRRCGFRIEESKYRKMYEAELDGVDTLEDLWMLHNLDDRPSGRVCRSLSMSDVICIIRPELGYYEAYYVDSVGFVRLERFFIDSVQ